MLIPLFCYIWKVILLYTKTQNVKYIHVCETMFLLFVFLFDKNGENSFVVVLWALGSTLANFDFVPYEFQFTVVKSLDVRRLGTTIPCPNITRQISFTEYLRNKVEGLHLDVDYYVIQYTNSKF